jgi:hypothetical protein
MDTGRKRDAQAMSCINLMSICRAGDVIVLRPDDERIRQLTHLSKMRFIVAVSQTCARADALDRCGVFRWTRVRYTSLTRTTR